MKVVNRISNQLADFFRKSRLLAWPRRVLEEILMRFCHVLRFVLVFYGDDEERIRAYTFIRKIKNEREMILSDNEAYTIMMLVKKTTKIKGDLAEVGVYRGGSARLICEVKSNRKLHLFDTFDGIPYIEKIDKQQFNQGQFAASLEEVKDYLDNYKDVYFYKGVFPETTKSVKRKKFSFVHLDVDTYKSTLDCLHFFYPRMSRGGIIISHDYINAVSVRKAFKKFFQKELEPIIEISASQCLIIKL